MVSLGPVCAPLGAKLHQATQVSQALLTASGLRIIIAKATGGREHAHAETITNMQKGEHCFPLSSCVLHLHAYSFSCLLNSSAVYSNLVVVFWGFLLVHLRLLSPVFYFNLVASPLQSSTISQAWPWRAATTFLQTPAITLIYSSLFSISTSCCSPRCSKFFNLPCWALARGNHSLPPTKLRLAHFKLSL